MHEKKRNKDRRNPNRHEPFIADITRRMKHQPLRRKLIVKLLDERLQRRPLELESERGNAPLEQFLVA